MINKIWLESFGDDYHERNVLTDEQMGSRIAFFTLLANTLSEGGKKALPASILEIGAGVGNNIKALERIIANNGLNIKLGATEPNEKARQKLQEIDKLNVYDFSVPIETPIDINYELVFTSGVLIHIDTESLVPAMRNVYTMASKYILCMEYFAPNDREILYRGQSNALWARDYGKIYLDNFSLKCLGFGFLWKPITHFDNLTWWLFEKVN